MITIKKYKNRRLYNTTHSHYVNQEQIEELLKAGEKISVFAHDSGENITNRFLLELVIAKTQFAEYFSSQWLMRLFSQRGSEVEKEMLEQLRKVVQFNADKPTTLEKAEISKEPSVPSELRDEPIVETTVKRVDDWDNEATAEKGKTIILSPDELLELEWEEDSQTEEVEVTQVSISKEADSLEEMSDDEIIENTKKLVSDNAQESQETILVAGHTAVDKLTENEESKESDTGVDEIDEKGQADHHNKAVAQEDDKEIVEPEKNEQQTNDQEITNTRDTEEALTEPENTEPEKPTSANIELPQEPLTEREKMKQRLAELQAKLQRRR